MDHSKRQYDLEERLLEFAAEIIRLSEALPNSVAGRHLGNQILRSGTSPLGQHGEAQGAESRKDFIHKMGVAHKELRETMRWQRLIHRVPLIDPSESMLPLMKENEELIRIFHASIATAKRNLEK